MTSSAQTARRVTSDEANHLRPVNGLLREGRFDEARHLLEAALERSPDNVRALTLRAQLALQLSDLESAKADADRAAALAPEVAMVQYTRGRVCKARGELSAAIDSYRRAHAASPEDPDILTSLGIALRAAGRPDEAVSAYQSALARQPEHRLARDNLANALAILGDVNAVSSAQQMAEHARSHRLADLCGQARAEQDCGRLLAALMLVRKAIAIAPPQPALLLWAASLASEIGDIVHALGFIDRLLEIDGDNAQALGLACVLTAGAGLLERLARYAARARGLASSDELTLLTRLALPAIHESREALALARARYAAALDELLELDLKVEDHRLLGIHCFYLAYHGECDKDLQIKAAKLWLKVLPSLRFEAPHCARRRPGRRIRVGFISRYFHTHSIGKTTRGLVAKLDRSRFETYLIRVEPSTDDATTAAMREAADHSVSVINPLLRLAAAHAQIAALELDVLFYQDIGMDPETYFLSFARLAPVQCVSFGHPDTTGVPTMDYFVSNDVYETEEAGDHYSERLFLLRQLPTLAYYYRPPVPNEIPARAALGLPAEGTLYLCPQTLFKVHPDFDEMLRAILERDMQGWLVLIRGQYPEWVDQLTVRFRRSMPQVADRVVFVPSLAGERFMQLLASGDVMLDTPHFNGMNSSLEALAVGLPVVTLPSRLQRGRHTRAMYLKMSILDCIARDPGEYVDIAVRLGTDSAARAELRRRILEQNHVLYEDEQVVREFERFFSTALSAAGVGYTMPSH